MASKRSGRAQSTATPILSAPAFLNRIRSSFVSIVGVIRRETGCSILSLSFRVILMVSSMERMFVIMEMHTLPTFSPLRLMASMMSSTVYEGQPTLMKLLSEYSPFRTWDRPQYPQFPAHPES